jgi:hypothetical protein
MLRTARRFGSWRYAIALSDAAIASVHYRFSATVPLEQVPSLLDSLALSRVLRMSRTRARLNDLPRALRAGDYVCLARLAHGESIPI